MESTVENVMSIYTNFGGIGLVLFGIFLLVFSQFSDMGKRVNKIIVEKVFSKKGEEEIPYDSFVRKIEHIRDYSVKKIFIKCPKRREVFYDFVNSRLNYNINFIKSLKDKDFSKMNNEELSFYFVENIYKIKEDSDADVFRLGIPQDVIDRVKSIESDEVKIFNNLVENICASNSNYISNNNKVAVIIDFLCALLGMIVSNAENAIDSLNGQLDSLTYKGYSCNSCSNSDCKKNSNRSKKNV